MKQQIRRGVFETNSSSVHTISLYNGESKYASPDFLEFVDYFYDEDDNYHKGPFVQIPLGDFGWDIMEYNNPNDKLSYLMTFAKELYIRKLYEETGDWGRENFAYNFTHSEFFKQIEEAVTNYCNEKGLECKGIYLNAKVPSDGYVDHQAHEDYKDLNKYLENNSVSSIEQYVFDFSCHVCTDNDNHDDGYWY